MDTPCVICNELGENLTKLPCCENRCHLLCGIHYIANNAHLNAQVVCPCGNVLYLGTESSSHINAEHILSMDGAKKAINSMKVKEKDLKKAISAYKHILKLKKQAFHTEIHEYKMAIQNAKKAYLQEIRQMPEYKRVGSLLIGLRGLYRRFKKKYASSYQYGILDDIRISSSLLYYSPAWKLQRIFRIRIL